MSYDIQIKKQFEQYEIYLVNKNGYYGILDENEVEIIPCIYEEISYVKDGFLSVKSKGLYSLVSVVGQEINVPKHFEMQPVFGILSDLDLAIIYLENGRVGLYSWAKKDFIIPPNFDEINLYSAKYYFVKIDNTYCFYFYNDSSNELISIEQISCKDLSIISFPRGDRIILLEYEYGIRFAQVEESDNTIENIGVFLQNAKFSKVKGGVFSIKTGRKFTLLFGINDIYNNRIASDCDKFEMLPNNDIAICKNEYWGLSDYKGETIIECLFDEIAGRIFYFGHSIIFIRIDRIWCAIAPTMNFYIKEHNELKMFETKFEDVKVLDREFFAYKVNNRWYISALKDEIKFSTNNFSRGIPVSSGNIHIVSEKSSYKDFFTKDSHEVIRIYKYMKARTYFPEYIFYDPYLESVNYLYYQNLYLITLRQPLDNGESISSDNNEDNCEYILCNNKFVPICNYRFEKLTFINTNFAIFTLYGKQGILSRTGDIIVEPLYEQIIMVSGICCYKEGNLIKEIEIFDESIITAKLCPVCKSNMILRKNSDTGMLFWGCSKFPACRGTRDTVLRKKTLQDQNHGTL